VAVPNKPSYPTI